jgi:hypothetical protein
LTSSAASVPSSPVKICSRRWIDRLVGLVYRQPGRGSAASWASSIDSQEEDRQLLSCLVSVLPSPGFPSLLSLLVVRCSLFVDQIE